MSKAKRYTPKRPTKRQTQGALLYLFTAPLFVAMLLALVKTNIQAFVLNAIAFFLFLFVAKLARKGLLQEMQYHNTIFTKAPKTPYKMYAGYLLGISTFFASAIAGGQPLLESVFLALIALLGYYLFYGFDPKEDKLENLGDVSADFVIKTIKQTKEKLFSIQNHLSKVSDISLHNKIKTALSKAKEILNTIQEDPKDIRVARKFLIVYVDGIAKVTQSYVELDEADITAHTKEKLHTLMDDVEEKFDKELTRLKQNNAFDLDVHIDVLKEQIKG